MAKVVYSMTQCLYNNPAKGVTVHRAITSPGDKSVAVKEIQAGTLSLLNTAVQEALNQAKMYCCEGVVKVYMCRMEQREGGYVASIVQELMDLDLHAEMERRKAAGEKWTEAQLIEMLKHLLSTLSQAQSLDLSHRDLKPQNIYLKGTTIKIGDFGSSAVCDFESLKTTLQGSPFFLSPELKEKYLQYLTQPETTLAYDPFKSDVYSLGVTFAYMITLEPPMVLAKLEGLEETTSSYVNSLETSEETKDVLRTMLDVSPERRPSFAELLDRLNSHSALLSAPLQALSLQPQPAEEGKSQANRKKKGPENCLSCSQPITGFYLLQDPTLVETFSKVQFSFCSEKCLRNFSVVCLHEICLHCRTPMIRGAMENHRKNKVLKKNFVLLQCGHMFHTKTCFNSFVSGLMSPQNAVCAKCKTPMNIEMLQKLIGKKKLLRAQTLATPSQPEESKEDAPLAKSASQEGWD